MEELLKEAGFKIWEKYGLRRAYAPQRCKGNERLVAFVDLETGEVHATDKAWKIEVEAMWRQIENNIMLMQEENEDVGF